MVVPSTRSTLRLSFLGQWQAELDGFQLPALPTRHARALLARLALAHPVPVTRAILYAELFPELPAEQAAQRFRTTLYYLRRGLGEVVVTTDDAVALDPHLLIEHDLAQFEHNTQPFATESALHTAITLYRGPFLDDEGEGWAAAEAQRLHARYLQALQRVVVLAQSSGRPGDALAAARRWTKEEPWEERAHLAVIEALLARGDRSEAETQIGRARAVLRAEWNQAPSAVFEALARQVARLPTASTRPPAPTPVLSAPPPERWDRLPLVGREVEFAQLRAAWAAAQGGTVQTLIVEGAAGTGKSRLVRELVAWIRLRDAGIVLWGSASEQTGKEAFGLLRAALRNLSPRARARVRAATSAADEATVAVTQRYLPELYELLPLQAPIALPVLEGAAERTRRQLVVRALIEGLVAGGPLVLVLEDTQWADDETLALVADLCGQPLPLMLLLTRRPRPVNSHPRFPALPLEALPPIETAHLVRLAIGKVEARLLAQLLQRSGGNPLFVREIVRTLQIQETIRWNRTLGWYLPGEAVGVPDPQIDLIQQRLKELGEDARSLAEQVAVLARPVDEQFLAQLWPDESARLDAQCELLRAKVLHEQGTALWFTHAWLGETLRQTLSASAHHRELAEVLRDYPATTAAEYMQHLAGAGLWDQALHQALQVAEEALGEARLPGLQQALEVAETALAALPSQDNPIVRWRWLLLRESYLAQAERGSLWQAHLARMQQFAQGHENIPWQVEVLTRQGRVLREQSQHAQAETALRAAATLAADHALHAAEAAARSLLASVLDDRGAVADALAASSEAVQQASRSDDSTLHLRVQANHAYMLMRSGASSQADALLAQLLAEPSGQAQSALLARLVRQQGIVKMALRQYEAGLGLLREAVQRMHAIGDVQGMLIAQTSLAYELLRFGLFAEGLPLGEATLLLARRLKATMQQGALLSTMAYAYFASGDIAQAMPLAQESATLAEAVHLPEYAADSWAIVAKIALALGDLRAAQRAIGRAEELLESIEHPTVLIHHTRALVWLRLGLCERARAAAQQAVQRVADQGLAALEGVEVLWEAAQVLGEVQGMDVARPLQQHAFDRFLDDLAQFQAPQLRHAWINRVEAHREVAAFRGVGGRRLVYLPLPDAPTGRPLFPDELVPVVWTVHAPDDPQRTVERRRHQLRRLTAEAVAQGARATVEALAEALAVSTRTLLRDIQALRALGKSVPTRGTAQR